ncbi:MAG: DinB family protein, partial [Chloroflexota bacterium]|nr:DinB family protein [Chloroflexota bacterium]
MDSGVQALLANMRASRRRVFAELEGLSEERLNAPATWGGREWDARFILLRYADHEEEHALQVQKTLDGFGWQQTEAQQILGAGQVTRGDLYGALIGLTDVDLDVAPSGEWPLRLTLWHIAQSDRSYRVATGWAAELHRA